MRGRLWHFDASDGSSWQIDGWQEDDGRLLLQVGNGCEDGEVRLTHAQARDLAIVLSHWCDDA